MTSEFIYGDSIMVKKTRGGNFVVDFEDDISIFVSSDDVHYVCDKTNEITEISAILIATIRKIYRATKTDTKPYVNGLRKSKINEGSEELLKCYHAEDLIQIFSQLKWHEICEIFNAEDIKKAFQQIKEDYQ